MEFKHRTDIQLRFKDADAMGHINNANHFTYFELARIYYLREVLGKEINWKQEGIILARMTIDYKKPLLLNDQVHVMTRCIRAGNKSFDLEYLLMKAEVESEMVVASGISVLVCYDYPNSKSMLIPEEWKIKLTT